MEVGISRRAAIAGGVVALCGAIVPQVAPAGEASETLSQIEELAANLTDDELVELERAIASIKASRGIRAMPFQGGTYIGGVDIDPGTYVIRLIGTNPEQEACLDITWYNRADKASEWEQQDWDFWYGNEIEQSIRVDENTKFEIVIDRAKATISPAKKISFSEE